MDGILAIVIQVDDRQWARRWASTVTTSMVVRISVFRSGREKTTVSRSPGAKAGPSIESPPALMSKTRTVLPRMVNSMGDEAVGLTRKARRRSGLEGKIAQRLFFLVLQNKFDPPVFGPALGGVVVGHGHDITVTGGCQPGRIDSERNEMFEHIGGPNGRQLPIGRELLCGDGNVVGMPFDIDFVFGEFFNNASDGI